MSSVLFNCVAVFFVVTGGYYLLSSIIQIYFYWMHSSSFRVWKIQPDSPSSLSIHRLWLPPLVVLGLTQPRPGKFPDHDVTVTRNVTIAGLFGALAAGLVSSGLSGLSFEPAGLLLLVSEVVIASAWQCVLEYYWHRTMHIPFFYRLLHKKHHAYKSPEVFDDMYCDSLEIAGYYCILYSPIFLPISLHGFYGYMIVMGLCGVLDHVGVKVSVPGVYDTTEHDNHHRLTNVNYSFPFPFMDHLHGTYFDHQI
jgi:sterol desaturase/sphingolipid hydroxylase (fatty acid hydroxylase superfamily)